MKSKQLQEAAGVSRLQVVRWVEAGVLIPLEDATGRGGRREFSQQNAREAALAGALHRRGIGLRTIREVVEFLRKTPEWLVKHDLSLREKFGREDYLSLHSQDLRAKVGEAVDAAEGVSRELDILRAYSEGRVKSWWDYVQVFGKGVLAVFDRGDHLPFTLTYPEFLNELFDGGMHPKSEVLILIDVHQILERVG